MRKIPLAAVAVALTFPFAVSAGIDPKNLDTLVKPSDDFTGFGSLTYGNLGSTRAEAAVTLPASETLQVRGAVLWNHRDDWVDNAYNPSFANPDKDDLGNFDDIAGRVHVAWTPTERLSTLLTLQARDYEGTGTMNRANALTKGSNKLKIGRAHV